MPLNEPERASADVAFHATAVDLLGETFAEAAGTVGYKDRRVDSDIAVGLEGCVAGDATPSAVSCPGMEFQPVRLTSLLALHPEDSGVDVLRAAVSFGRSSWRLIESDPPPSVEWTDAGIETTPMRFIDAASGTEQVGLSGSWRTDGNGALHVTGDRISLDTLLGNSGGPAPYGGTLAVDATVRGTRDAPTLTGTLDIAEGRVRKLSYDRLNVRFDYADDVADIDLRLDQTPTTWLTAKGRVPLALFSSSRPDRPMDVTIASSPVNFGLVEGLTDLIHNVTGQMTLNATATGTSGQPQVSGTVAFTNAGFILTSTGGHYQNGNGSFKLTNDRVDIADFRIEDRNRRPLVVTGSFGTRELAPTDLRIDAVARHFEVLHDENGTVDVDGTILLRGTFDAPRLDGDVTIVSGELRIDQILERTLFQPYSTQAAGAPAPPAGPDAIDALNPWDRLRLDMTVHSPGSLRLTGENVQVSEGTPLGLGSFNLRATGDIYLFKDPGQPFYMTGSFDSINGTYAFQGRRFEIDPTSSINFRGDLDPEIYVTVKRIISGVEARVTISGTLHTPELRLASTPPLESSEILSLIVFNATTNELNPAQQQELAIRAGTLAYGFVATPLMSALQRSLGLETLEIAPPDVASTGPKVTVGGELVPGLVAQFTRQFGQETGTYNEAVIEYYLSRIFRIRATFSDAGELIQRSPFRRVERAGIDLIVFLSF
jgi:autotransporter translocation and assembly factor TamB